MVSYPQTRWTHCASPDPLLSFGCYSFIEWWPLMQSILNKILLIEMPYLKIIFSTDSYSMYCDKFCNACSHTCMYLFVTWSANKVDMYVHIKSWIVYESVNARSKELEWILTPCLEWFLQTHLRAGNNVMLLMFTYLAP